VVRLFYKESVYLLSDFGITCNFPINEVIDSKQTPHVIVGLTLLIYFMALQVAPKGIRCKFCPAFFIILHITLLTQSKLICILGVRVQQKQFSI